MESPSRDLAEGGLFPGPNGVSEGSSVCAFGWRVPGTPGVQSPGLPGTSLATKGVAFTAGPLWCARGSSRPSSAHSASMLLMKGMSRALLLGPGCSHTPPSQANRPGGLRGAGLGLGVES